MLIFFIHLSIIFHIGNRTQSSFDSLLVSPFITYFNSFFFFVGLQTLSLSLSLYERRLGHCNWAHLDMCRSLITMNLLSPPTRFSAPFLGALQKKGHAWYESWGPQNSKYGLGFSQFWVLWPVLLPICDVCISVEASCNRTIAHL